MNPFASMTTHGPLARMFSGVLALNLFFFGLTILLNPESMHLAGRQYLYAYMLKLATAQTWGTLNVGVALFRLASIGLGVIAPGVAWFAMVRALGSAYGVMFWLQIVIGAFSASLIVPACTVFTTFTVLELINMYNAVVESFIHPRVKAHEYNH